MLHRHRVALAGLAVAALLLATAAAPAAAQETRTPSPDITIYRIELHGDGNATWSVELRRRLTSSSEREGFEAFRDAVRSGNVTVFGGIERDITPLVEEAENATGRSMSAVGFSRDVAIRETVTGTQGVTSVRFTWTNFSRRSDGKLVAGDVFVGSGLTIGEGERLVIEYGDDLVLTEAVPEPEASEDATLQWNGRRFFEEGRPRVTLRRAGGALGFLHGVGVPLPAVIGGIVVLLSGFFGGLYIGRRAGLIDGATEPEGDGTDEELLTDEDRVVRLLEEHEGRMKQAEIVESTGWSKSKVSMVLSQMEDEERISKLRLGRENVIDLEGD